MATQSAALLQRTAIFASSAIHTPSAPTRILHLHHHQQQQQQHHQHQLNHHHHQHQLQHKHQIATYATQARLPLVSRYSVASYSTQPLVKTYSLSPSISWPYATPRFTGVKQTLGPLSLISRSRFPPKYKIKLPTPTPSSNSNWSPDVFNPRSGGYRQFLEDGDMMIYLFLGLNTLVYLGWTYSVMKAEGGDRSYLGFMERNFYSSWDNMKEGRYWTMITSSFSHSMFFHFALNMFVLHSFGRTAIDIIGARRFPLFYIMAGIASSTAHLVYTKYINPIYTRSPFYPYTVIQRYTSSHGASGSISATTLLFALTYPWSTLHIFFFVQVPAIVGIGGFVAYDVYQASTGRQGQVNSAAHVGGAMFGVLYWLLMVRRGRWGGRNGLMTKF